MINLKWDDSTRDYGVSCPELKFKVQNKNWIQGCKMDAYAHGISIS